MEVEYKFKKGVIQMKLKSKSSDTAKIIDSLAVLLETDEVSIHGISKDRLEQDRLRFPDDIFGTYMCSHCFKIADFNNVEYRKIKRCSCSEKSHWIQIDKPIAKSIASLNKMGFHTYGCCSGHGYNDHNIPAMQYMYVSVDKHTASIFFEVIAYSTSDIHPVHLNLNDEVDKDAISLWTDIVRYGENIYEFRCQFTKLGKYKDKAYADFNLFCYCAQYINCKRYELRREYGYDGSNMNLLNNLANILGATSYGYSQPMNPRVKA